jgi:large subunit ribosomal protein L4
MQASVLNMAGEKVGEIELADNIFNAPINTALMHQALTRQLANARLGTAKVKTRGEVAGGGRKPWKQKGTGRARQGSIRAAQWRKGGIIFGPTPRSYDQRMPRKMRHAALCSALTVKAAEEKILLLDELKLAEPKTREMALALQRIAVSSSTLILLAEANDTVERSAKNLPDVKLLRAHYLNIRDLMTYEYVIIPQDALAVLEGILG